MGLRALAAGAIALSLMGAMPERVNAAFVDTQVGAYSDGGTFEHVLGLATASDMGQRAAAIIIRGPDPSKDEYKPRAAIFSDKQQWGQFTALWNKARHTQAPKRTNINGDSVSIGQFFDRADAALVHVSVNDDATIEFSVIDKDKWPMLFRLQPKDFDAFDRDVKKVSEYFAK